MCAKVSVKRRIISIINEEFERQSDIQINSAFSRPRWTYNDEYWSSLLTLSSDK